MPAWSSSTRWYSPLRPTTKLPAVGAARNSSAGTHNIMCQAPILAHGVGTDAPQFLLDHLRTDACDRVGGRIDDALLLLRAPWEERTPARSCASTSSCSVRCNRSTSSSSNGRIVPSRSVDRACGGCGYPGTGCPVDPRRLVPSGQPLHGSAPSLLSPHPWIITLVPSKTTPTC